MSRPILKAGWAFGHHSMLAVINFGAIWVMWYREPDDDIELNQMVFTRGIMTDALVRMKMLAVKILWKNLDYFEPQSDILTHSLYQIVGVNGGSRIRSSSLSARIWSKIRKLIDSWPYND